MATKASTSIGHGTAGGIVATLIGIPILPIAYTVATLSEKILLARVMHVHTTYSSMSGGQRLLGNALVGGATGLFTAFIAGFCALKLIGIGRRSPFLLAGGTGYAIMTAVLWLWITHKKPEWSPGFDMILLWVLAIAGLGLIYAVLAEEVAPPRD